MNHQLAIKTLANPKATKNSLREALAFALGVEYAPESEEKRQTLFSRCKEIFCEGYAKQNGFPYMFSGKDGKALKELIEKVKGITNDDDETIATTFLALIEKLPGWYKKNHFSLSVINSKFNEIVSSIKMNKNGNQSGISNSYKQKLLDDLHS